LDTDVRAGPIGRYQGWCDMADESTPESESTSPSPESASDATLPGADPIDQLGQASAALENVDADLASAQASIDELLKQANFEDPTNMVTPELPLATQPFEMPNLSAMPAQHAEASIELLRDVDLNVKIELGRSRMLVEDVLKLGEGSVVELDKLAGDPVDVFVNDRLVARGEVLVLNDNFCVRVNEIMAGVREEGL
jgi:flagellar motor switch protein FliN/FliY